MSRTRRGRTERPPPPGRVDSAGKARGDYTGRGYNAAQMTARRFALLWGLLPSLLPAILLYGSLAGRTVPSFRDQSDFFYPTHRYTANRILARELPLWNSL